MIILLLVSTLVGVLLGVLFYQPWMDPNYKHYGSRTYTKKELKIQKFKKQIKRLLKMERYESILKILSETKYTSKEVPMYYWNRQIQERIEEYKQNSSKIPKLIELGETLEKKL